MDLGNQLRKVRTEQNLTLEQMASLTGVSRPMLSQIERGTSSPTVNTLWKIATGLKIPFSMLLCRESAKLEIARRAQRPDVLEENGAMRVYTLFPFSPSSGAEVFLIELDGLCKHPSRAHQPFVEERIYPLCGRVGLMIDDQSVILEPGEILRFQGSRDHLYFNPDEKPCSFYNEIVYGGNR